MINYKNYPLKEEQHKTLSDDDMLMYLNVFEHEISVVLNVKEKTIDVIHYYGDELSFSTEWTIHKPQLIHSFPKEEIASIDDLMIHKENDWISLNQIKVRTFSKPYYIPSKQVKQSFDFLILDSIEEPKSTYTHLEFDLKEPTTLDDNFFNNLHTLINNYKMFEDFLNNKG